jgi:hypothetical protein
METAGDLWGLVHPDLVSELAVMLILAENSSEAAACPLPVQRVRSGWQPSGQAELPGGENVHIIGIVRGCPGLLRRSIALPVSDATA